MVFLLWMMACSSEQGIEELDPETYDGPVDLPVLEITSPERGIFTGEGDLLYSGQGTAGTWDLTTLELRAGTSATGFIRGQSGAVLLLVDVKGQEHRLQKELIASRKTIPHSLMPSTFENLLKEAEFHDLLGWLLSLKNQ